MIAAKVTAPCFSTAASCNLDWTAISAIGGWLAAIATFFAVLLPYLDGRRKEAARTEMQISDLIPELRSIRDRIRFLREEAERQSSGGRIPRHRSLQIAVVIPGIEPTKKLRVVTDQLRIFQAEVARWNVYARGVEEEPTALWASIYSWHRVTTGLLRLDATITGLQDAIAGAFPHMADAAKFGQDSR